MNRQHSNVRLSYNEPNLSNHFHHREILSLRKKKNSSILKLKEKHLERFRYDKIEAKIIREFHRHGVTPENPAAYSARYGDSLLDTKDLLQRVEELGITEDLVKFFFFFVSNEFFFFSHYQM